MILVKIQYIKNGFVYAIWPYADRRICTIQYRPLFAWIMKKLNLQRTNDKKRLVASSARSLNMDKRSHWFSALFYQISYVHTKHTHTRTPFLANWFIWSMYLDILLIANRKITWSWCRPCGSHKPLDTWSRPFGFVSELAELGPWPNAFEWMDVSADFVKSQSFWPGRKNIRFMIWIN